MLDKYVKYLNSLNLRLDGYFDDQREFIACKAGCGICCRSSYYAASELEYQYVRIGFNKLPEELKSTVNQKALGIIKTRKEFLKTNSNILAFSYECPFLLNEACSIYEYRPMLCRSHGLIYKDIEQDKFNAPHCMTLGLNYARVWDDSIKNFSAQKASEIGIKNNPKIYDLSYSSIMRDAGDIEFGDVRMMVEWIVMDIPNYKELIK